MPLHQGGDHSVLLPELPGRNEPCSIPNIGITRRVSIRMDSAGLGPLVTRFLGEMNSVSYLDMEEAFPDNSISVKVDLASVGSFEHAVILLGFQ